jgi:hypothetical protein
VTAAAAPIQIGKPVGKLLISRHDAPPCPIPRALAVWFVVRLGYMTLGGYELGVNEGPLVRLYHRVTGTQAGGAWCAARQMFGLFLLGSLNPLELHAYCPDVAENATVLGILDAHPEVGDLVLFWELVDGVERFAHIGLVVAVNADGTIDTLEGNTNSDGSRDGWQECKKHRPVHSQTRFVHWHHLIPEAAA